MKHPLTITLAFLAGATVSALITWQVILQDSWRTHELLEYMQYLSELDYFVRLLALSDEDIKCQLSKAAASSRKYYADFDFGESPRFGPTGLATSAAEQRNETIERYDRLAIDDYAKKCLPKERLYFKDSER